MKNSEVLSTENNSSLVEITSRRDFFKKTAINLAGAISAASILSPVSLSADDEAIIKEAPWGQKLGDTVDKNL